VQTAGRPFRHANLGQVACQRVASLAQRGAQPPPVAAPGRRGDELERSLLQRPRDEESSTSRTARSRAPTVSMILGFYAASPAAAWRASARSGSPSPCSRWAALLLGEPVGPLTLLTALAALSSVAATQRGR
jgi:hypothetical protein